MSNLCFPSNGDWLKIDRSFSEFFYETGIEGFLPFINDAWVDIIKTENQRFGLKGKYKVAMAEMISYGNTVLGHSYNPKLHFLEPFAPSIANAGNSTQASIAKKFGVARVTINHIICGVTWGHIAQKILNEKNIKKQKYNRKNIDENF